MREVHVRVPATSANLGPGFDCLALALQLYNDVVLRLEGSDVHVHIQGEGADTLPVGEQNLVATAALRAFDVLGYQATGLRIETVNRVPTGSGLGSSAAAVIAGLLGANALVDGSMGEADILALATEFEGHADNAAAALSGGLVAVRAMPDEILVRTLPITDFKACVVIPALDLPTSAMRDVLPAQLPLATAVINQASLVMLVEALRDGNHELLSAAAVDQLHEPYRLGRIRGATAAVRAGYQAGALAVVLSGAGPGLLAISVDKHELIGQAMVDAFDQAGVDSRMIILPIDRTGAQVEVIS